MTVPEQRPCTHPQCNGVQTHAENIRGRPGWQCDISPNHINLDPLGFNAIKDALIKEFNPSKHSTNLIDRTFDFRTKYGWFKVVVTMEYDEDFDPAENHINVTELVERLRQSPNHSITVSREGIRFN